MSSTNFKIAPLHYAEIKHSNWLLQATWLALANKKDQTSVYEIGCCWFIIEKDI